MIRADVPVPKEAEYSDFVRISKEIMRGRSTSQQRQVVNNVLMSLLPPGAPAAFRWGQLHALACTCVTLQCL